jgi:hypothetical protein
MGREAQLLYVEIKQTCVCANKTGSAEQLNRHYSQLAILRCTVTECICHQDMVAVLSLDCQASATDALRQLNVDDFQTGVTG